MNIGDLWFRYDTSYQSEVYNDLTAAIDDDPDGVQPSWTMANFSAGLAMSNGTTSRSLYTTFGTSAP